MGLFATLEKSKVLGAKAKPAAPKKDPKTSFIKAANEKISAIESGDKADKGKWFKKTEDGTYLIWPRCGIAALTFKGEAVEITCANKKEAITMMGKLIEACKDGEFDDQFADVAKARAATSARPRKAPKAKTNGAAAHA